MPGAGPQAARPARLAVRAPSRSPLRRYTEGDRVQHHHSDGPRPGRVVRTLDQEGLVEVDFGHEGTALVGIDEIEPEAA
jgi:hypothetical protein